MARAVAGGVVAATMVLGRAARADEPCAAIHVAPSLAPGWSAAVDELARQLAQLPAGDCEPVTLTLEARGEGVRLVAEARDGRRTERVVKRPESLVATGLGLVMAIPRSDTPPEARGSAAPPPSPPTSTPPSTLPPPATSADAVMPSLWLGVDIGGRVAEPTSIAMVDVGVHGTLVLRSWLLSLALRSTPLGLVTSQGLDNDAFRQVDVGVGFGRRFMTRAAALDLLVEPSITAMRLEYDGPGDSDVAGEDVELTVSALARLALPLTSTWALTLTLEGGVTPGNAGSTPAKLPPTPYETPAFPAWQTALRVGAMGALL